MRTIRTTTGVDIPLDGDLLAILETLYRDREFLPSHDLDSIKPFL